jgi:long-chain fatty acid transport protein
LRFSSSRIPLLTAIVCLAATSAFASGFSIFEQGAKASGMAGAFVATADDPSAVFYNPAGLAQQRELTVLGGATFINFTNEFVGDFNSPITAGTEGKYDRHLFVPPNGYAVVPIGENLSFGIGTFAAFGLRTDWQDPWVGRFISRDVNLKTVSVNPTIAWRTSDDRIAIGGGLEYRRARVTLSRNNAANNPFTGRITDVANGYLSSDWDSEIGFNVGVLLKPTSTWRIGATYRSSMDVELGGTADITQIPSGNAQFDAFVATQLPPDQGITTTIPFPAMAAIGIATSAIENWDIEFDITYASWSRFETLLVEFDTTPAANIDRPQDWQDTFALRLGANRRIGEEWQVRLGAVYDQNPQPTEAVSPLLPDADRIGITFGFGWQRGPFIVDVSEMILHFKDRTTGGINPDGFEGTYKTDATLLSVNFGLRF